MELLADRERAPNCLRRPVEEGEEAVAGGVDLLSGEPRELSAHGVVVRSDKRGPGRVPERSSFLRRADEIGEENRRKPAAARAAGSPRLALRRSLRASALDPRPELGSRADAELAIYAGKVGLDGLGAH